MRDDSFNSYLEPGEWNKLANLEELCLALKKHGIDTYEADLSPLHRFLIDFDINFDINLNRLYFDLEN